MADIRIHPRDGGRVEELLADHIHSVVGSGRVISGRLCPACGSDGHGAPWARLDGHPVAVSLSRSGPHLVTAVAPTGRLGVDVESIAAVARGWHRDLVLAPGEDATTDEERAWLWAAKEAVLKAHGIGLARPMNSVSLAAYDVRSVPAPPGYVVAAAVLV